MSFRPRHLLFAVALLLAPLPPAAAVEKCISPQGKVTYSESACPPGTRPENFRGGNSTGSAAPAPVPAAPAPAAAPASAGRTAGGGSNAPAAAQKGGRAPVTQAAAGGVAPRGVSLRYFDVQGGDAETLLAALAAGGGVHGKGEWKLSYRWETKRLGRYNCGTKGVSTQLDLSLLLPRWNPPPGTSTALFGRWTRYQAALRTHLEEHIDIGREFETAVHQELKLVQERCTKLEARVQEIYEGLLERYRKRDADYDRETANGRTQGVDFR